MYKVPFLESVLLHGGIDGIHVRNLCTDVQRWLDQSVNQDAYSWEHLMPHSITNGYADYLHFTYEEDLLAFKLKFGV